jgi:hypothetical protein
MKTTILSLACGLVTGGLLLAQAPSTVIPSTTVSPRDGFTQSGTSIIYTHGGVSQKIVKEVVLDNGLRVQADGTVSLPNGEKATLRNNQLLTLQGDFEDVALTPGGVAPITSAGVVPAKADTEVGLSAHDGISVSGNVAMMTRNGVTERLTKEVILENGMRVQPSGRVIVPNGGEITLRADQVLTFGGVLRDAPAQVPLPAVTVPAVRLVPEGAAASPQ